MRNDLELDAIIEDYLLGKLSAQELIAFEQLRQNDASVDHKVVSHKMFMDSIQDYAKQVSLRDQLDLIHQEIDVDKLSAGLKPHQSKIVELFRKNKLALTVAASFLVLSFISIYSLQHSSQQVDRYLQLGKKVDKIEKSQSNLIRNINSTNTLPAKNELPGNYGGTGFAISSNGYIVTNLHVINKADSIYIQNNKGESFKVKTVYTDNQYDIAILKIDDKKFIPLAALPYSLKRNTTKIGENVYTLGFPKDDAVLGEGYVSSKNGFTGDTTQYQISIPVNPGNSGGPLLDNNGNLVGVISGKEMQTDGATFAIKSKYIIDAMRAIPQDSLGKRLANTKKNKNKKNALAGLKRTDQIERLQDYVFMVKVYQN